MPRMTEHTLAKARFMQEYHNADGTSTLSFYNGARMDTEVNVFFVEYVVLYSCATFYVNVPAQLVKDYLGYTHLHAQSLKGQP